MRPEGYHIALHSTSSMYIDSIIETPPSTPYFPSPKQQLRPRIRHPTHDNNHGPRSLLPLRQSNIVVQEKEPQRHLHLIPGEEPPGARVPPRAEVDVGVAGGGELPPVGVLGGALPEAVEAEGVEGGGVRVVGGVLGEAGLWSEELGAGG